MAGNRSWTPSSLPAEGATVVRLRPGAIDDEELVEQLRAQRPAAVNHLIDRYSALVRRSLYRVLGSTQDLDDLEQDTFVTVLARCHTLRDPGALRSFVVSVAMRLAKNELRKRAIRRFVGLDAVAEQARVAPYDAVEADRFRRVYTALDQLDANSRIAFVLRHVEGCELSEVATACGCSLSTVKRWLSRAETELRDYCRHDETLGPLLAEEEVP